MDECQTILLTEENIENILDAVMKDALPHTTGFFFGASGPEDKAPTIEQLIYVKRWLKSVPGRRCYYRASW